MLIAILIRMEEIYLNHDPLESILDGRTNPTNLPLPYLRYITQNFSEERKIAKWWVRRCLQGIANFSCTFRASFLSEKNVRLITEVKQGVLSNNRIVAVKKLSNEQNHRGDILLRG